MWQREHTREGRSHLPSCRLPQLAALVGFEQAAHDAARVTSGRGRSFFGDPDGAIAAVAGDAWCYPPVQTTAGGTAEAFEVDVPVDAPNERALTSPTTSTATLGRQRRRHPIRRPSAWRRARTRPGALHVRGDRRAIGGAWPTAQARVGGRHPRQVWREEALAARRRAALLTAARARARASRTMGRSRTVMASTSCGLGARGQQPSPPDRAARAAAAQRDWAGGARTQGATCSRSTTPRRSSDRARRPAGPLNARRGCEKERLSSLEAECAQRNAVEGGELAA